MTISNGVNPLPGFPPIVPLIPDIDQEDSELSLSETKQKFFAAYVNLYKALGGGWITQKEKEDSEKNSTATN